MYNYLIIIIISARDVARIQDEDDNLAQKKKLTKQRARESLESQIDLSQREAKKELIKGRKVESYKNQVFFFEKNYITYYIVRTPKYKYI